MRQAACVISALLTVSLSAYGHTQDETVFSKLFTDWTTAFNHQQLSPACALFSTQVTADYRGQPPKHYAAICDGFKKIFADPDRRYYYEFKLHQVYREGNLAAARITWYLHITDHGKALPIIQDEGLDILTRDAQGRWSIINYLAYEV